MPEPPAVDERQHQSMGAYFLVVVAALAVLLSILFPPRSPPSLLLPPVKEMSPWIYWKDRRGDVLVPRILVWTGPPSATWEDSRVVRAPRNQTACNFTVTHDEGPDFSPRQCTVTYNRSLVMESDVIVFQADLASIGDLPRKRASGQRWVFWARTQPAALTPPRSVGAGNAKSRVSLTESSSALPFQVAQTFNWTMGHREDAVIRVVHKTFAPSPVSTNGSLPPSTTPKDRSSTPRWDAAWIISACEQKILEKEHERVGRLKEGEHDPYTTTGKIDVQLLPNCGAGHCSSLADCVAQIAKKYKFIVVSSTPACFQSIDDLVYEAFKHDIVPVVLASPNIKLNVPPDSVVSTADVTIPGRFHERLRQLLENPKSYESYFAWKRNFATTTLEDELCPLCHAVQKQKQEASAELDYREWWELRARCRAELLFDVRSLHIVP